MQSAQIWESELSQREKQSYGTEKWAKREHRETDRDKDQKGETRGWGWEEQLQGSWGKLKDKDGYNRNKRDNECVKAINVEDVSLLISLKPAETISTTEIKIKIDTLYSNTK